MAGKRFDPSWLARHLEPYRFVLNLPEVHKDGISFVRPSSVEHLFEHVLIRTGRVAYSEAVISAASFTSCKACISERDDRFRSFLSGDSMPRTSRLSTWADARAWQKRLIENADVYCNQMAVAKGPVLARRLEPVLGRVDSYKQALGDMLAIFDREFAFVSEGAPAEQATVEQLATLARSMLYLNQEDATLASVALVRFGEQVEGKASPFQGKRPHSDYDLAVRLILLTDYVQAKRLEYNRAGGLWR